MSFLQIVLILLQNAGPFLKELLTKKVEGMPAQDREGTPGLILIVVIVVIGATVMVVTQQNDQIAELEKKLKETPPAQIKPLDRMYSEDYLQRMVVSKQLEVMTEKAERFSKERDELKKQLQTSELHLEQCELVLGPPITTGPPPPKRRKKILDEIEKVREQE